jgi:hypothetical protein
VHRAESQPEGELLLEVIRADGTRISLGRAALITRNPLKRLWWDLVGARLSTRRIQAANRDAARRASNTEEA